MLGRIAREVDFNEDSSEFREDETGEGDAEEEEEEQAGIVTTNQATVSKLKGI